MALGLIGAMTLSGCGFPGSRESIEYWRNHPEELEARRIAAEERRAAQAQGGSHEGNALEILGNLVVGGVIGARHAHAIRNAEAARNAWTIGRGLQETGRFANQNQGYNQPTSRPVLSSGAWDTSARVTDFYLFVWEDRNNNNALDCVLMEEVGAKTDSFNATQGIGLFTSIFGEPRGKPLAIRLYSKGSLLYTWTDETGESQPWHTAVGFRVKEPGEYKIGLAVGDREVKSAEFRVSP